MLDFTKDELNGKPVFELYHPTSLQKARAVFSRYLEGHPIRDEDLVMMRRDGAPIPIRLTTTQVRDARGKLIGSRSMAVEITDRHKAEQEIGASFLEVIANNPSIFANEAATADRARTGETVRDGQNDAAQLEILTEREKVVLALLASGATNADIGAKLNVSEGTVRRHVSDTFSKLELRNRAEAAAFAVRAGLAD